jgi:glycerol-3-phosphate cytidylyltransferase
VNVLAVGTWDLFHPGHVRFLWRAKQLGSSLVVGVNTDEFAAVYKRRPVMSLDERVEMVGSCRHVDMVLVNEGGADAKPLIEKAAAGVVAHGDDWTGESYLDQLGVTPEYLRERGIVVAFVPYTAGISTSALIARCLKAVDPGSDVRFTCDDPNCGCRRPTRTAV